MRVSWKTSAVAAAVLTAACGGGNSGPREGETAPGAETSTKTAVLESSADLLQATDPVDQIGLYLNGFHTAKNDPTMQMEAHHYCNQVNEDFAQCALFDGNTKASRLMGIEYIISDSLYSGLAAAEKAFWHPHNYEILSGQLRLPGVPDIAEKEALKGKMNSYGKTWHTWMTGMHGREDDALPLGPPVLQWSLNRDGEDAPGLVSARDERMGLNTAEARGDRADLASLAKPQGGVDAMAGLFPTAKPTMAGVTDNGDKMARPVPTFGMKEPTAATQ
jgi:hypothetical protein